MPQIHVKHVRFDVKINDDFLSYAYEDLATWKPRLRRGWYYLGPAANDGDGRGCAGVIVKPAGGTPLVPIAGWEMVWSNAGSNRRTKFALWRGVPAPEHMTDYIVIGSFFTRSHNPPTASATKGMMAIHKDNLVTASHGKEIWNDAGTYARMDGAVWGVSTDGNLQAVGTGVFVPVEGYDNPPRNTYALDRYTIVPEA